MNISAMIAIASVTTLSYAGTWNIPTFETTICYGSWKNGSEPTQWFGCDDSRAEWRFRPGKSWNECNFGLEILFSDTKVGTVTTYATLTILTADIVANQPGTINNYLTCIACPGGPYAGICGITDGIISSAKAPIPLVIEDVDRRDFQPMVIDGFSANSPSGRPGQPCKPSMSFNITDPNAVVASTTCSKTWQCNDTLDGRFPTQSFQKVQCEDKAWHFSVSGTPRSNFTLQVAHRRALGSGPGLDGGSTRSTLRGKAGLTVPKQLAQICGASGVCYWGLQEGVALPVVIDTILYQ